MAKTSAERRRQYRERALRDPDGLLLTRLQVLLSPLKEMPSGVSWNQLDFTKQQEVLTKGDLLLTRRLEKAAIPLKLDWEVPA